MLEDLQPLMIGGERVLHIKETKYLGVWFDQRFKWNKHIQKTTNKSTIALGRCERLCRGRLGPKMNLWL